MPSMILKKKQESLRIKIFWYVKVCTLRECILYIETKRKCEKFLFP